MYKKLLLGGAFLCGVLSYGQEAKMEKQNEQQFESLDEVVIIDSKFDLKRENSGKVVAKITEEELAKSPGQTLPQVINRISGIEITGTRGNGGQNLGYYIRGGRNRQVVIMVDGIQMNDPSSIANDFDLRLLPLSRVKSIEIIKGAASTLYGSGAATAVIHIQTKDPVNKKIGVHLYSSVGTNQTADHQDYELAEFQNSVAVSGNLQKFNYQAGFGQRYSDNLSAINLLSEDVEYEEDPFEKYNFHARVGYEMTEDVEFYLFGNYDEFTSEYDNYNFTDNDNEIYSNQLRLGSQFEYTYNHGSLMFTNSFNWLERELQTDLPNTFDSKLMAFDVYNKYKFNDHFFTLIGLNGMFSSFNSFATPFGKDDLEQVISEENAHFEITDPYVNVVYISDFGFNLNVGTRLNIHSDYGTHWVYNFNPSYTFNFGENYLKTLFSYSTAYVTPSLYQLYNVSYGNINLEPEESRTMEAGLEYNSGIFRLSTVYFNRKEAQFIDFILIEPEAFQYQYQNISEEFTAEGFEAEVSLKLSEQLLFSGNYTFTEVEERFALRIPKHKINASLGYSINENWNASFAYQFNGERTDAFFNPANSMSENIVLENFSLLDVFLNYRMNEHLKFFAAITNITNEEYRELYGYATRGRNVRIGFNLRF